MRDNNSLPPPVTCFLTPLPLWVVSFPCWPSLAVSILRISSSLRTQSRPPSFPKSSGSLKLEPAGPVRVRMALYPQVRGSGTRSSAARNTKKPLSLAPSPASWNPPMTLLYPNREPGCLFRREMVHRFSPPLHFPSSLAFQREQARLTLLAGLVPPLPVSVPSGATRHAGRRGHRLALLLSFCLLQPETFRASRPSQLVNHVFR